MLVMLAVPALASCATTPGRPTVEAQPLADLSIAPAAPVATIGPLPTVGPVEANAVVEHVVDGDTIDVRLLDSGAATERVRLIGIDTPESKKPNTPVECFAKDASAGTASLLRWEPPSGSNATSRSAIATAACSPTSCGRAMAVRQPGAGAGGYASVLTYPPNVAHTDEFVTAVAAARTAGVGLWGRCESGHEPA